MRPFTRLPTLTLLAYAQQVTSMPAPSGLQPGVYEETNAPESIKAATLRDIQECTDRPGKALWRPGGEDYGLPLIKQKDVVATDPIPDNYAYHARLAVMSAWSRFAATELRDMFASNDSTRRDRYSYCIYDDPEMSKVTVTIGTNRTDKTDYTKYPPHEITDLPNKLGSVRNVNDWPTHWPYLLGQTLRDKWYQGDIPEDQPKIIDGKESASDEVYRILLRSNFTPVIMIEPGDVDSKGVWGVSNASYPSRWVKCWDHEKGDMYGTDPTPSLRVVHVKGVEERPANPLKTFERNEK